MLSCALCTLGLAASAQGQSWYSSSWNFRKAITIDYTRVGSTGAPHTDFPVLISVTDSDLSADAQSDGDDILFTSSNGTTKLDHEIEKYTSGTGLLVAWVRVSSLSAASNTVLYMYYGNGGASNQQNATGVWNSSYKGVWHLKETAGGTGAILDATSNANHGTDNGSPTFAATGIIGNAISFDGSNDYISVADSASLDITGSGAISAWYRLSAVGTWRSLVDKGTANDPGETHNYGMEFDTGNSMSCVMGNGTTANSFTSMATYTDTSSFHHVVLSWDGSNQRFYFDGSLSQTNSQTLTPAANTASVLIGAYATVVDYFNGRIDEVRISSANRSAGWILTEYNNGNSPGTFLSVSSEECFTTTWTGTVSTNWFTAGNWNNGVPTSTCSVIIPGSLGNYPSLTAAGAVAADLTVQSGASLAIGSQTITVGG
ncbi:MAG: DUF2341 domain-containing protein, partial [Planctomycetota bacterium]